MTKESVVEPVVIEEPAVPATKEDLRQHAAKSFVAQIAVVVVTPLTVALSLYLTDFFKRPSPRIEYITPSPMMEQRHPDEKLGRLVLDHPQLQSMFIQQFATMSSSESGGGVQLICSTWPYQDWDEDCLVPYMAASASVVAMAAATLESASKHPLPSNSSLQSIIPNAGDMAVELEAARALQKGFADLDKQPPKFAGNFELLVGVMNTGDSDGVVFDSAVLTVRSSSLHVFSDGYVPVKAHGFEEVTFRMPFMSGGNLAGRFLGTEEKAWLDFLGASLEEDSIPFDLAINLSDKTVHKHGLLTR